MKHELTPTLFPACVCGYRTHHLNDSHARKMMDLHFRSRHDYSEHLEVINQLVAETARRPGASQDLALAILHLVECLEQIDAPRYG